LLATSSPWNVMYPRSLKSDGKFTPSSRRMMIHYARCTEFIHYILARPVDFRRPVAIDLFEKFLVLRKDKYPRATFAHQLDQTIGVGWIAQTGENASAKRGPSQALSAHFSLKTGIH
jgi:hypothetical protein